MGFQAADATNDRSFKAPANGGTIPGPIFGAGPKGADGSNVIATDTAVAGFLADRASATGVEVDSLLAPKVTQPGGPSGGNALVWDPVAGQVVWGALPGALVMLTDGTLETTVPGATGTQSVILEGGGFMNGVTGPDPAYSAQAGAPLELWGDVYGSYASLDGANSWVGSNDGVTDVKHMKGITVFKSKTSPNVSYRYTSNWNLTNASSVVSCLWKHTYDPTAKRVTATLLFDTAGSTSLGAQANLYRAMGDGASHPRQTGKLGVADPLVNGRGWLAHGDGVVQFTESGGVVLKALNGAASKNQCSSLCMDPVKDPTTGIDLYVTVANGTDAGVWKIANAQLPGIAGSGGGPTATKLTGGSAPFQPMGIVAVNLSGTTHLLVTDAGLPSNPGGIRHWNGTTWSDITPTGAPTASSGLPAYGGGLAYPATVPSPVGGTSNTGVIVYKAIDAVVLGGGTIRCIVGHDGPDQSATSKMMWTDDALTAAGWHFHVDTDNLASYPQKGSGKNWWLPNAPNGAPYSYFAMTKAQGGWDCSDVWIDRNDTTKAYACGRSGLWFINLSGTVAAQPADNGVGAAISLAANFHPTNPLIGLAADSDWTCLHWTNIANEPRLIQHTSGTPALPNNVDGREVRIDALGGGYVSQAQRSTFDNGDVWYTPDTTTSGSWYSLMHGNNPGLSAWTDFGVRGLVTHQHTDGEIVLLAFIGPKIATTSSPGAGDPTHAGIWKLKGLWNNTTHAFEHSAVAQTWTRVSSTFSTFTNQYQVVRGSAGRTATDVTNVYAYDPRSAGLVRSTDYGDTWTAIFPRTDRAIYRYGGAVKTDKLVPNRVWVTIPGGATAGTVGEVWRIDNAHNGTLNAAGTTLTGTITATRVNVGSTGAMVDNPGQLVVKTDGTVIVHQGVGGPTAPQHPGLWASKDSGATWADLGNADFRGLGGFVYGLAISADDQTLMISCDGNGVTKYPLQPPSQTVDIYTKAQVNAIQAALAASIAAFPPADVVLSLSADFVVNNNNSLADVTGGTATLAVGTYEVSGYLAFDSSATNATTAKCKIALVQGTATATGEIAFRGTSSSNGGASASINTGVVALGSAQSMGAGGVGTTMTAVPIGRVVVTVAGTLKLQWAQNVAEVSNTTLHQTSYLVFKKIA